MADSKPLGFQGNVSGGTECTPSITRIEDQIAVPKSASDFKPAIVRIEDQAPVPKGACKV